MLRSLQLTDMVTKAFAAAASNTTIGSPVDVSGLLVQKSSEVRTYLLATGPTGSVITVNPDWLAYGISGLDSLSELFEGSLNRLALLDLVGPDEEVLFGRTDLDRFYLTGV